MFAGSLLARIDWDHWAASATNARCSRICEEKCPGAPAERAQAAPEL